MMRWLLLLASGTLFAWPPVRPQEPAMLPYLVGAWQGEGDLFGRSARFSLTWSRELGGRFLGLTYRIEGAVSMEARAHYRTAAGDSLRGVWVDSRGEILELHAIASDSTLETLWRSPTESGRTTYRRVGRDSLVVEDFVRSGDAWRPFGTARYGRR